MEDKKEYVKAQLKNRTGELTDIAYKTGVGRRTISYIMTDHHAPTARTINHLYGYLKRLEKSGK